MTRTFHVNAIPTGPRGAVAVRNLCLIAVARFVPDAGHRPAMLSQRFGIDRALANTARAGDAGRPDAHRKKNPRANAARGQ